VHLGGIVACFTQDVDDLPDGVFSFVGPFHHFHDGLITCLSAFQLLFRDKDIVGKRTVFRYEESI